MFIMGFIFLAVQVAEKNKSKKLQNKQSKNEMANEGDKLWMSFMISGILGIIAFFFPFMIGIDLWYWDYIFTQNIEYYIAISLILGGIVLLLLTGIYSKKTETHNLDSLGFFGGIFLLLAPIVYFMGIPLMPLQFLWVQPTFWISLAGGILGLIAWVRGLKYNKLNKISKAGMTLTSYGFMGYLVNFIIPTISSWAYYFVVGPAWILIGFVVFGIGLIKSMFK